MRILLVEDHETVRQGLKLLIDREADLEVIGEASDGAQAIERGHLQSSMSSSWTSRCPASAAWLRPAN
jgi:DNA-binding NarL/FixJ family response regulator